MIWTMLFAITITQGIFLISLIAVRVSKNSLASRLIIAIIVPMILTNFGYLVTRTELVNYMPQFFGIPYGMMFFFGLLLYFYSRSVIDKSFHCFKKSADHGKGCSRGCKLCLEGPARKSVCRNKEFP